MPSDLERAMETLIIVFHRYASKASGNPSTLNRKELKMLMETELSSFLKVGYNIPSVIAIGYTQGGATLNIGLGPLMIRARYGVATFLALLIFRIFLKLYPFSIFYGKLLPFVLF